MGTVGGNLFTPPPGGDVATALLALDARVELMGPAGSRILPIADFWTGFLTTALGPEELVTRILVPLRPGRHAFLKLGRKAANTPAVVTVAIDAAMDGDVVREIQIALGAAGPHPLRSAGAEAAVAGRALTPEVMGAAAAAAVEDAEPFADAVASAWYRRRMVGVLVGRALAQLTPSAERGA
jgi:carbon-monoxide dehydrogenase medium subunit